MELSKVHPKHVELTERTIVLVSEYEKLLLYVCVCHLLVLSQKLLTLSGISQLSTHNSSIIAIPRVITHSTPLFVHADLHPAFVWNITSCQSETS